MIRLIFIGRITGSKGIYTISECFDYLTDYFDRFYFRDLWRRSGVGKMVRPALQDMKSFSIPIMAW